VAALGVGSNLHHYRAQPVRLRSRRYCGSGGRRL